MKHPKIKKLLRLSLIGVRSDTPVTLAKRIILTNLLGYIFAVNMSVSALFFFYFGFHELAAFTCFFVLTELMWPLLNSYGRYNISRIGLLISSNFLGFFVSITLPATGYNRGFFVMAGLPILLFSLKEKKSILLGLVLPLCLYPLSEWLQYSNPFALTLSPFVVTVIRHSIGTVYVLLIFLMFWFLSRENDRSEKSLEDQRSRSFSSSKFAALGEMASGIGHEINNPLTVIELNTEHLKYILKNDDFKKEEILERVGVISKTVKRVAQIVKSMRSFSRDGRQDPFEKEKLSKIIEDTLVFCSERFKNHGVKLEVTNTQNIYINCRSVQISQVLLNLLNNSFDAVESLPEKWVTMDVKSDIENVIILVTDSGKGILKEHREKIFQPFFTTKPVGKGTGLGLSLSRSIVQEHGGRLFLDTKSLNTRFVVQLSPSEF